MLRIEVRGAVSKVIEVKPVTRIEGHAKIKIWLDEEGNVEDAHFHVLEVRGFERFLIGRPIEEAPLIVPRICGICYTCHHLASAKAVDAYFGLQPEDLPETANMLRELMLMGNFIHSHSLHFYALAAPDFIVGPDADPRERNLVGVIKKAPEIAKNAIRLRAVGIKITEIVGGKAVHPVTAIPGGVSKGLTEEERQKLLPDVKWAIEFSKETVELCKQLMDRYSDLVKNIGVLRTYHLGLVGNQGVHQLYHGNLRFVDPDGNVAAEFPYDQYLDYIAERVEEYSYLKFPYFKKAGWPSGVYRVNTLSRLNVADKMPTPLAQEYFEELRRTWGKPIHNTLLYNLGRCIELLECAERSLELLENPKITGPNLRVPVKPRSGEGIGVVEAQRGTLIHHYAADAEGLITDSNIIVATVQNNPAFDRLMCEESKKFIKGGQVNEGLLNRLEMLIRAYDPCLSCATHTIAGHYPLVIEVVDDKDRLIAKLSNLE